MRQGTRLLLLENEPRLDQRARALVRRVHLRARVPPQGYPTVLAGYPCEYSEYPLSAPRAPAAVAVPRVAASM